ncbi:MAG TPA: DoxX family protein [Chitinophaga sp.]|uniref:DoxX family protein n=1 Tax=Chitinophaga sp. TaxID=1869181 RepID=UPI002BCAAEE2|nr:DoxX family protein [Chitinophaga sp.]HVI47829.1 DoxX family protein [Chitinophaga sp.]
MTELKGPSKAMHIFLWIAQVLLAGILAWGAAEKLFRPISGLAAMWPWAGQIPAVFVRATGLIDLAGAAGLILPALLRIRPKLTPIAAVAVIVLMICAGAFHIIRGEAAVIGANIFFAAIAAFIAWGRFYKAPVTGRL